ncbi:MAG: hypothetical protein ISR69_00255 [Gammaproteobacteria bacterium]|nr:hypothetical protein [Gammaproteobacteria bacterium]
MILNIRIDDQQQSLEVPDGMLSAATDFFSKMDTDMDNGWQMSQRWVDMPTAEQRCQVAGNKILIAIDAKKSKMMMLMAAYVLYKLPNIKLLDISTNGDMFDTFIEYNEA